MNLINLVCASNRRKLLMNQKGNDIQVTRAATAINPLTCYNVSTGNVMEQFAANTIVKHGDYAGVFGDSFEVTFDYGTKQAGDVVSCPMKIYRCYMPTLQPPTNITSDANTGFQDQTNQTSLDKIKAQDGTYENYTNSTNLKITQLMLELDLNPLCNQKYSGSRTAMVADLKVGGIIVDIWAKGSGANGGVATDGVKATIFDSNGGANDWGSVLGWASYQAANNTGSITKMSMIPANAYNAINSSNKLFVLVYTTYPSDGANSSNISIDSAKITLQFSRQADTVAAKPVYLPKYWMMVVKGFSPNFDSTQTTLINKVFTLWKDSNNYVDITYSGGKFNCSVKSNGYYANVQQASPLFSKYQIYNFLVVFNGTTIKIYALKNNGVTEVFSTAITNLTGRFIFTPCTSYTGLQQGNSFTELFQLYDLQALGKIKFGEEKIINGGFDNGGAEWIINSGAWDFSTNQAILTADINFQSITRDVEIEPNKTYICSIGVSTGRCVMSTRTADGTLISNIVNGTGSAYVSFTAPSNAAKLRISLDNNVLLGTFTFDNISLKQIIQAGPTDAEAEGILRGIINTKNLFDKNKRTLGYYLFTDGTLISSTLSDVTDFIKISPDTTYVRSGVASSTSRNLAFYDSNKNFISYINVTNTINLSFVTPINAEYLRITLAKTDVDTYQLEKGSTATAYEPYLENPLGIQQKELFDISKVSLHANARIEGNSIVLNATGTYQSSIIYVSVLPNNKYTINFNKLGGGNCYLEYRPHYNNIQLANSIYYSQGSPSGDYSYDIVTPPNTNNIMLRISNTAIGTYTFSNISLKLKM